MFLRTTEFLWQEGHTAHATSEEALEETMKMLGVYEDFARNTLAIPVICGEKTPSERFPGAISTFTIEAMMQDRKALQCGTSHFLGQNFAKASQIQYRDKESNMQYAWTTSWGLTTRLIGALIMTHSDDDGLIMPPRIAASHIVLIPVVHKEETRADVMSYVQSLCKDLKQLTYAGCPLHVTIDDRDMRGGDKTWHWIKKGIPLRLEIGPRDIAADRLGLARRDKAHKELTFLSRAELLADISSVLDDMQNSLLQKAESFRDAHIHKIDSKEEFYAFFTPKNAEQPEVHGGFAFSHWSEDPEVEEIVKKDLNVTIRCIPLDSPQEEGRCVITGKKSSRRVLFAKAY
jgi:prolyl-tRNA synthetase